MRFSAKRLLHFDTESGPVPSCSAMSRFCMPSAASSTMRARNTSRTLERPERTVRCRMVCSSAVSSMHGARRMLQLSQVAVGERVSLNNLNCVTLH